MGSTRKVIWYLVVETDPEMNSHRNLNTKSAKKAKKRFFKFFRDIRPIRVKKEADNICAHTNSTVAKLKNIFSCKIYLIDLTERKMHYPIFKIQSINKVSAGSI